MEDSIRLKLKDIAKHTKNNGKIVIRKLPGDYTENEFRVLTQNYSANIKWVKLILPEKHRKFSICFVQIHPVNLVNGFINDICNSFFDSRGGAFVPQAELAINQNVPDEVEKENKVAEELEGYGEFLDYCRRSEEMKSAIPVEEEEKGKSELVSSINREFEKNQKRNQRKGGWGGNPNKRNRRKK